MTVIKLHTSSRPPQTLTYYLYLQSYSIIPRVLSGNDDNAPWPTSSTHASFTGPVDLDTFHIKGDVWLEALTKTSVFIKLGSYLLLESGWPYALARQASDAPSYSIPRPDTARFS